MAAAAPVVAVRTPAVVEVDPRLCRAGHGNGTATDHVTLRLQAAAPGLVLALIHAAAEPQIDIDVVIVAGLALTVHILSTHPDMEGEGAHAPPVALLHGDGITGGQGGLALAPQATTEQEVRMLAGSGAGSLLHP